jgi:hypothetical protein
MALRLQIHGLMKPGAFQLWVRGSQFVPPPAEEACDAAGVQTRDGGGGGGGVAGGPPQTGCTHEKARSAPADLGGMLNCWKTKTVGAPRREREGHREGLPDAAAKGAFKI